MELNAKSLSDHSAHQNSRGKDNHINNNIKNKKVTMTSWNGMQKAASTTNGVRNAPHYQASMMDPASPIPHHGQRPSLAGFDPFLTDEEPPPFIPSTSTSPSKKSSLYTPRLQSNVSLSPYISADSTGKTTKTSLAGITVLSRSGRPTETHGDNSTTIEKRSQSSRDTSPAAHEQSDRRQPPSPPKSPPYSNNSKHLRIFSPVMPNNSQREGRSSQPSSNGGAGGGKLLPFLRKGHRRSKSLEGTDVEKVSAIAAVSTDESHPVTPTSEPTAQSKTVKEESDKDINVNSKTGNTIVQELMEIKDKFMQLQIPSLAKPSPTSFLTGKGDEAVRTSEYEPSPFQMEIPSLSELVEMGRLNDFVENYRRMDQNFDLHDFIGCSRLDLQQVKIKEHVPIAQSLLECGDGLTVQGFLSHGSNADDRLESVVFEGERYFTVVFRGTTEQQTKLLGSSKSKRRPVPFDPEQENVEVYSGFKEEYTKLEQDCFALVDKLSEQNLFCDVVFSGYSFGAAMATLAATRYATARPMMRVGCFTLASPKVGFSMFRHVVNSLPNLKVTRVELGQDSKCQAPTANGYHVGHTLVLNGSIGHQNTHKIDKAVQAYKFDTPKHKKFKTTHPDLRNYTTTLEEMTRLHIPWVKDFVNTSGKGVVVNNEARQVV
jgi:hypothetical protein